MMTRSPRPSFFLAALSALAVAGLDRLAAQSPKPKKTAADEEVWPQDPWTKKDADLHERLGYLAVGRMTWADRHDTPRIREALGDLPLIFLETAHFKLCVELPSIEMPKDKVERARLIPELERLASKFQKLEPKNLKRLDPWLRAHLFAQRVEELYAEIQAILRVTDESFPPAGQSYFFRGEAPPQYRDPWMGRGPYLGQRDKYLVMAFTKGITCTRYLSTFTQSTATQSPSRWYFGEADSFLFATGTDFAEGAFVSDAALHANITHNLVHNLLDGFKAHAYATPIWWKEGLAHCLRRRITDKHNNFQAIKDQDKRAYSVYDWEVKLRARLSHDLIKPLSALWSAPTAAEFDLIDHASLWSRLDFVTSELPPEQFANFLGMMKGFVDDRGNPPTWDRLLERQNEAFRQAFGVDPDGFDTRWKAWLVAPRRKR